jgi:hypothetical protein
MGKKAVVVGMGISFLKGLPEQAATWESGMTTLGHRGLG